MHSCILDGQEHVSGKDGHGNGDSNSGDVARDSSIIKTKRRAGQQTTSHPSIKPQRRDPYLVVNAHPSSFRSFWNVCTRDKSVLNILRINHNGKSRTHSGWRHSDETYSLRITSKGLVSAAPATPAVTDLMAERVSTACLS